MRDNIKQKKVKQLLGVILPVLILFSQFLNANMEVVSSSEINYPKMSSYDSNARLKKQTGEVSKQAPENIVNPQYSSYGSNYGSVSNPNVENPPYYHSSAYTNVGSSSFYSGSSTGDGSKTFEKYSCSSGNTSIGSSVTYEKVSGMKEVVVVQFANGKIKKLSGVSTPAKTVSSNSQNMYDLNGNGGISSIYQDSSSESRTGEHIGKMGTTTYDLIFNDQEEALSLQYRTGNSYNQYIKFQPGKPQSNGPDYTNYNVLLQKLDKFRMFVHCCSQKPQLTDLNKCQTSYDKYTAEQKVKKDQQALEEAKKAEAFRKSLLLPSQRKAEADAEKARLANPFAR